jgi:hypothetical protein
MVRGEVGGWVGGLGRGGRKESKREREIDREGVGIDRLVACDRR